MAPHLTSYVLRVVNKIVVGMLQTLMLEEHLHFVRNVHRKARVIILINGATFLETRVQPTLHPLNTHILSATANSQSLQAQLHPQPKEKKEGTYALLALVHLM
jgi:hypothetical protein